MCSEAVDMMNRDEIVEAIKRDGYVVMPSGLVLEWKRGNANCSGLCSDCIMEQRPDSGNVCCACLELDECMPREDCEASIGGFVLADKKTVMRAVLNNQL